MTEDDQSGVGATELAGQIAGQRGGEEIPEWTWLAKMDLEFMRSVMEVAAAAFSYGENGAARPDPLSTKEKELVAVALLAAQRDEGRLRVHLRRALERGATPAEVVDVLRVAMVTSGVPALRLGIEVLMSLLPEPPDDSGRL